MMSKVCNTAPDGCQCTRSCIVYIPVTNLFYIEIIYMCSKHKAGEVVICTGVWVGSYGLIRGTSMFIWISWSHKGMETGLVPLCQYAPVHISNKEAIKVIYVITCFLGVFI